MDTARGPRGHLLLRPLPPPDLRNKNITYHINQMYWQEGEKRRGSVAVKRVRGRPLWGPLLNKDRTCRELRCELSV
jgi:hypothetical protein